MLLSFEAGQKEKIVPISYLPTRTPKGAGEGQFDPPLQCHSFDHNYLNVVSLSCLALPLSIHSKKSYEQLKL